MNAPTKPSGIPWLGNVPAHWEVKRLKHVSSIRYGVGVTLEYVEEGLQFVRATDVFRGKIRTEEMKLVDPEDVPWSRNPGLHTGEIVVVRSGAYTGDSAIIPQELEGSIAGYDMVATATKAHPEFIAYSLLSKYILEAQLHLATMRAAQPHLNSEELGNIIVILPPLPEQRAIAAFLDERTARIDGLVARKRRLVQLLKEKRQALITRAVTRGLDPKAKLKESGVPWLGEVPEGWEVKRMAYLGRFRKGRGIARADITDEGVPAILYGDLYTRYDRKAESLVKYTTPKVAEGAEEIQHGDLLLTGSGETKEDIGKCIVYLGKEKAFAGGDVIILRQGKADSEFLSFALNSGYVVAQKTLMAKGDIVVHIYSSDLRNVILCLPPTAEQVFIVSFLNKRTAQIDMLITKVGAAIERLQEYRTALISAAVTGKVRVGTSQQQRKPTN